MGDEDQKPTPLSLTRQQRRSMARAAAAQAVADREAAGNAEAMAQMQKKVIDGEFELMHRNNQEVVEAERHAGGAFINMQAIPRLQNARMAATNQRTGRHFLISFPIDLTDMELLEIFGWLGGPFRQELQRRRMAGEDKASPLTIARSMPKKDD